MEKILKQFIEECNSNLKRSDSEVDQAKGYLSERTISEESIETNKIGYCYKDQYIDKSIVSFGRDLQSDEDWGYRSQISKKVILPIFSEFDKVVGFATHTASMEKCFVWWNLPKPFYKGNHLFLLNKSRNEIYDKNKVYIVEGYVDAIMLHQHGLKNVVALMGTALTQRKISLIMRYCDNVCFCLDTDLNGSGQNARDKSVVIIDEFGFCDNISTIDLPMGEDPASYVSQYGLDSFMQMEKLITSKDISKIKKTLRNKK